MEIITEERVIKETKVKVYLSDLIFFLKQRKCLKSFENHVQWKALNNSDPLYWICHAFVWLSTPEGEFFWYKINQEWIKFLKSFTKDPKTECISAFTWQKTPEGFTFWENINKQWLDALKRDMPGKVVYENIFDIK